MWNTPGQLQDILEALANATTPPNVMWPIGAQLWTIIQSNVFHPPANPGLEAPPIDGLVVSVEPVGGTCVLPAQALNIVPATYPDQPRDWEFLQAWLANP
jgi:hypothetical protein